MKIAMLGHKRMPSREGGVEVVVEELSVRMAALGHDVTVYSRKGHNVAGVDYDAVSVSEYKGVTIKEVPTLDIKGLAAVTSSFFATKAAIADKPDVIHFHAEGPCAAIGMAKKAGIRTVATIHGLDWRRAKWGKVGSAYIKHGEKTAVRCADEIIVLSEGVQDYFLSEYGRTTLFVPNGVNAVVPKPLNLIAEKYGLKKDGYVLFLGRIVPEKGIHYLVDAFKHLDTQSKLVIAGGASDSQDYFDKIKQMAADDNRILFTDFVQGEELSELYSNASIYVLPSDLEGMPMSLLEAMAYGCCCLASDIEECASVLDSCGETFEKGSVQDLSYKLDFLLRNAQVRQELGLSCHNHVLRQYDWDSVMERTLEIYEM